MNATHILLIWAVIGIEPPSITVEAVEALTRTMTDESLAWDERLNAENVLMKMPAVEVLQGLISHIADGTPPGAMCSGMGKKHDHEVCPPKWQVFYAVHRSWNHQVKSLPRDTAGEFLLGLLGSTTNETVRTRLIENIGDHWVKSAASPMATLLKETSETLGVRLAAGKVLAVRAKEDYHDIFLEYASHGEREVRQLWFDVLLAQRNKHYLAKEPRVVVVGFELILEAVKANPNYIQGAYFLATNMGQYVGRRFRPDQSDPTYHDQHGLNDKFFEVTVLNSIAWWANNEDRVRASIRLAK